MISLLIPMLSKTSTHVLKDVVEKDAFYTNLGTFTLRIWADVQSLQNQFFIPLFNVLCMCTSNDQVVLGCEKNIVRSDEKCLFVLQRLVFHKQDADLIRPNIFVYCCIASFFACINKTKITRQQKQQLFVYK